MRPSLSIRVLYPYSLKAFSHLNQFQCAFATMRIECAFNSLQAISHYSSHQRLGRAKVVTTSVHFTWQSRVESLEKMEDTQAISFLSVYLWLLYMKLRNEHRMDRRRRVERFLRITKVWSHAIELALNILLSPYRQESFCCLATPTSHSFATRSSLHVLRYTPFAKRPSIRILRYTSTTWPSLHLR